MYTNSIIHKLNLFFAVLFAVLACSAEAGEFQSLQTESVEVLFDASLKGAAEKTLHLYPFVKKDIESLFTWKLNMKPYVLLIKNREHFLRMAGDSLVVAFAVPDKNLIVIDYSKMIQHPFSLETTLKHELTHLLLHQHINEDNLSRWLDEGLCQWASGGIGEVIRDPKHSFLNRAAFSGRFIQLRELRRGFPYEKKSRLLAYEEGKSFVTYIVARFGKNEMLNVLNDMKKGKTAEEAIQTAFSTPFEALEKDWQHSLRKKMTWFTFLSYYLYEILFTFMAFITIAAFIRIRMKKKIYGDDDLENGYDDSQNNVPYHSPE